MLNDQELLNAVFSGPWLTSAKQWFSKTGGAAAGVSEGYVKGVANRQEYLALALKWIARRDGVSVEQYMGVHAHDLNSNELRGYFTSVIEWARAVFPKARKELKSVDWAKLYDEHGQCNDLDSAALEARVAGLMADDDVTRKYGVYEYVLTGKERLLNLRQFSDSDKATMFARQQGRCNQPRWTGHDPDELFEQSEMQADHIVPWSKGGRTDLSNGQMLCAACNSEKSNK